MASRARSPLQPDGFSAVPPPTDPSYIRQGYGTSANASHLAPETAGPDYPPTAGNPADLSPLSQSLTRQNMGKFNEDFDASQRGSSLLEGDGLHRSASSATAASQSAALSRSGTLKKKNSLSRKSSLKRSASRRSLHAGSIKGVSAQDDAASSVNQNSVFYTPIPTSGSPTEILANRFQAWRKLLKDIIAYFREVQTSYEHRAKALLRVSNVINNTNAPSVFLTEGGINEANRILRDYHKQAVVEANKARDIEVEVIGQLSGLRADLGSKIKEIKSLSGDFKNSVEKEKEQTRKAVAALEDALAAVDIDPSAVSGKGDPYVVRLAVERQVERQIDEENYLHRAYLNLEGSGRELESIVVGEIQKAYNALATILKRDADEAYSTVERLRSGPIAMEKDHEWTQFVEHDPHFVNPNLPLRRLDDIEYPGKHHPAAAEVRAGMLERKSKYLKSYTPGWYVLSPTHLHEFKSADRIYTQPPVMSLYLPEQKLGTHSQPGSSSHKFVLKGRQTGSMHRGHSWVFRAESYDTMMAWYEDIKSLTEKSGEERNNFVRRHTRSVSAGSARSVSDSGLEEDEADAVPYSATNSIVSQEKEPLAQRPSPGGRFPSDVQLNGHLQAPLSPSSGSSEIGDHDLTTAAGGLQAFAPGVPYQTAGYPHHDAMPVHHDYQPQPAYGQPEVVYDQHVQAQQSYTHPPSHNVPVSQYKQPPQPIHHPQPYNPAPRYPTSFTQVDTASSSQMPATTSDQPARQHSTYGHWMGPAAGGAAAGALGADAYQKHQEQRDDTRLPHQQQQQQQQSANVIPPSSNFSTQIPVQSSTNDKSLVSHPPVAEPEDLATPHSAVTDTSEFTALSTSDAGDATRKPDGFPFGKAATTGPFAAVMRQNTDGSVSDLHVPGEFPRNMLPERAPPHKHVISKGTGVI